MTAVVAGSGPASQRTTTVPASDPTRAGRDSLVDCGATLVLAALALVGFGPVFDDVTALAIGMLGAVLGLAIAWLSGRLGWGASVTVLAAILGFLLGSGPAAAGMLTSVIPDPLGALDGLTAGWSKVLTTAPPVPLTSSMGVVPYLCGFIAGAGGGLLSLRTRQPLLPSIPSLLALVGSLIVGGREPASVVLQGALFFGVAVVWGAHRANRSHREIGHSVYWPRVGAGAAMVVVVLAVALVAGPHLPFGREERLVVRDEVVPPFDPRDYPSPLAGFRAHRLDEAKEAVLFRSEGLPDGTLIRLAVMDTYDGVVWAVGGPRGGSTGHFERVGRDILPVPDAPEVELDLEVVGYRGVWIPSVGATRSVRFGGENADQLGDAFRYNRATSAGASPILLIEGDELHVDARRTSFTESDRAEIAAESDLVDDPVAADGSLPSVDESEVVDQWIADTIGDATTAYEQIGRLETVLHEEGFYSDGLEDVPDQIKPAAGHSLRRLEGFLQSYEDTGQMVGNDEQYAALMAFALRRLGLPARVVLGFRPEEPDSWTGGDLHAWVEVAFESNGWVPFFPTPDEDRVPEKLERPLAEPEQLSQQEPPPDRYIKPPDTTPELAEPREDDAATEGTSSFAIPAWVGTILRILGPPVLAFGAVAMAILGAKWLRRRRRRTRGTPVDRISGAWKELMDRARELGSAPTRHATRLEIAGAVPPEVWAGASSTATGIDELMFGPAEPGPEAAAEVWRTVDAQRRSMGSSLSWRRRLFATLDPRSLRPRR